MGKKRKSRVLLVDPNNKKGQAVVPYGEPGYNIMPSPEDLSILVELTTKTKGRTILISNDNGYTSTNNGSNGVISFISGSSINGGNYLSTSFTDLNGSINEIEESLGITSIDINFSSSYAPMVNINFVDLKGGAIFQDKARGRFGVLFKLPYPIFKLKIKGHYGKPVTYMLHLIKVTSKLNSDSGNFEITANFVGYTYAILSDMLVGYLKATSLLKEWNEYNQGLIAEGKPEIMGISTLLTKLKDVKNEIDGIGVHNPLAEELGVVDNLLTNNIPLMEGLLNDFISKFTEQDLLQNDNTIRGVIVVKASDVSQDFLDTFHKKIIKAISEFNSLVAGNDNLQITGENQEKLTNFNIVTSLKSLNTDLSKNTEIRDAINKQQLYYQNYLFVFNINPALNVISAKKRDLTTYKNNITDSVALELKNNLQSKVGINSTIKFLVEIFAAHIEAFLGAIWDVSKKYNDALRIKQLQKFKSNLDIKHGDPIIYPWPEYNENGVEKYLGSSGVLDNPRQVPEVDFVERLYEAMISMTGLEQDTLNYLNEGAQTWIACNPMDTRVFNLNLKPPYLRISNPTPTNIAKEVLVRAVIFLSVTNRQLTTKEVIRFAKIEAEGLFNTLKNTNNNNLRALSMFSIDDYLKLTINGEKILTLKDNEYVYAGKDKKAVISVEKLFEDNQTLNNGDVYTSNYNASGSIKPDEGSVYLKVIENDDYSKFNNFNRGTSILQYDVISKIIEGRSVDFLPSDDKSGLQEFYKIAWSGDYSGFGDLPLAYIFYQDGGKYINSFAGKRKILEYNSTRPIEVYYTQTGTVRKSGSDKRRVWENETEKLYESGIRDNIGNGNALLAVNQNIDSYPFINFGIIRNNLNKDVFLSLFGSRFYYEQNDKRVKALLFLHTFPWNGLVNNSGPSKNYGVFSRMEIMNLFAYRGGFINVPTLWLAFIGGLLWRSSQKNDPIRYNNDTESFLPYISISTAKPTKKQYLLSVENKQPLSFSESGEYVNIEDTLFNLPESAKKVFIDEFEKFLNNDWDNIRHTLELMDSELFNGDEWVKRCDATLTLIKFTAADTSQTLTSNDYTKKFNNFDNYETFIIQSNRTQIDTFIPKEPLSNNIFLEIKDGSNAVSVIKDLYTNTKWLANIQYGVWSLKIKTKSNISLEPINGMPSPLPVFGSDSDFYINQDSHDSIGLYRKISVTNDNISIYLKTFKETLSGFNFDNQDLIKSTFNSTENDDIKLNIYRNIKSIYDKWIAGSSSKETIFFTEDEQKQPPIRLIDTFKFLNRSFTDIGDKLLINPLIYKDLIISNPDQSFYGLLAKVLNDNNMDFIPLPSYINFKDVGELEKAFIPYPYSQASQITDTGPSFICMYIGQPSTKLDFDEDNGYAHPNDGFDFDENGVKEPIDFGANSVNDEGHVAAFVVNYGQQNQNIFKSIQLDQAEFTETAESLKVMNDISNQASQLSPTYAGQNLYNVYSVRSYKAEIEMMGNVMVQPMMYFQLNNTPMFHGAYVIINVKHNIIPNSMKTTFTGVRIRAVETPLVSAESLYSVILGDFKGEAKQGTALKGNLDGPSLNYVVTYHKIAIQNQPK